MTPRIPGESPEAQQERQRARVLADLEAGRAAREQASGVTQDISAVFANRPSLFNHTTRRSQQ